MKERYKKGDKVEIFENFLTEEKKEGDAIVLAAGPVEDWGEEWNVQSLVVVFVVDSQWEDCEYPRKKRVKARR